MCPVTCLPYHLLFPRVPHIVTLHQYMSVKFSLPNLSETRPRRKIVANTRAPGEQSQGPSQPPTLELWMAAQYGDRGGDVVGLCFQDGCEFTNATTVAMADISDISMNLLWFQRHCRWQRDGRPAALVIRTIACGISGYAMQIRIFLVLNDEKPWAYLLRILLTGYDRRRMTPQHPPNKNSFS